MTENQRVRALEKAQKRAHRMKPAWSKSCARLKKKRSTFWTSSPQKECGSTMWFRDKNGEWKCRFVSNREKRFGVVHKRAIALSLI